MSGIDKASEAFDTDMSGGFSSPDEVSSSSSDISEFFPHLNNHEDDEVAGGDNLPLKIGKKTTPAEDEIESEVDEDEIDPEAEVDEEEEVDPEAEVDDEEEDPDEKGEVELFDVIVDGEPTKVSFEEMKAGYIRTETFHRRLNKLDEAEKLIESAADVVINDRKSYIAKIDELTAQVEALIPAEPNWDELFAADPNKARKLQKDYELMQTKLGGLKADRAKAIQENNDEIARRNNKWKMNEASKLATLFPAWTDPQKGEQIKNRDIQAMAKTARAAGFTDDEIVNTHDSRMIVVLNKAAAYDRIMSKKPKSVSPGTKPVKSGVGRVSRTAPKTVARAQTQLSRTGRVEDAAAVFARIIK